MAEAIFLDVLPKFGFAAMEAGLAKFKSSAEEGGRSIGASLTGSADEALKKLQLEYTNAANAAADSARLVTRSNSQIEISTTRLAEVTAKYGETSSQAMKAALAESDARYKNAAAIAAEADASAAAVAAKARLADASVASSSAVAATGRALNTVGAVSAVAFTAAMYESAKAAGDFQQSQMRLVSSAGETADGMKTVSDGLLKMAGDVGYSAGELSTGMYTVESAGYRGADGLKVMQAAAEGAKAENADLRKVTDGLTTSMTDFNYAPEQASLVMSKLVTAVGESKANFEEFTGSLHSVEPIAAAAHLSLDDVYGSLARITQSGTSADQATQNMADAIRHLQAPSNEQAAAMAKLGISAEDVQQKLSQRGLAGTMQYLSETIRNQMDPAGNISISALNENAQAAQNAADMMTKMSPAAASVAQAFANGTMSRKDFTGAIKASDATDAAQLSQFGALELKLDGFSKQYKNGRSLVETYGQALKEVTGTVAGANVALQLSGDHTEEVNKAIKAVAETTTDADGKVKGFNETQQTLNAKMADAKAAFGAAAIELGNSFIPALTTVAQDLAETGKFLAEHKTILDTVVISVGALGTAWVVTKTAMAIGNLVSTIGGGMAAIGGFVTGLAGKYDALAISAEAAAKAERDAASPGNFAKGGAAGTAARGAAGLAAGALPLAGVVSTFALEGDAYDREHNDGTSNTDAIARGRAGGNPTSLDGRRTGGSRVGVLPTAAPGQDTGAANQDRRAGVVHDWGIAPAGPTPPSIDDLKAAADAARPDITDPNGSLSPEDAAAKAKAAKAPAGDKNDPIWISAADAKSGEKGSGADVYNPFAQFQSGGFTPASLVGFATAFALNQALGNPYGKQLAAQKRGESPDSPMYVSQVDVDNAQTDLKKAIQQYGPDSKQAQDASAKLAGTQTAVGTTGGYFDPRTGGLTAHDPSKIMDPNTGRMVSDPNYGSSGAPMVNPGKGAEGWRGTVADTVAKYGAAAGIPSSQFGNWTDAIVRQIQTESSGNPGADNPNDSNGRGGTQHVAGLLQYLPSTYANSAQKLTGNPNMMDPVSQIAGALLAGKNAAGGPTDIGNGIGWGPSRQPVDMSLVRPTAVQAPVSPSAPAPQTYGGNQPSGSPFGAPESLSDLRSLFTGGGGEGPTFKKSPGPAPAPPAPFGGSTDGLHYTDGQWFNGAGQPVRLSDYANGARPRTSGLSPFAPGGVLGGASPAAPGSQFGGIGQPGVPGGAPAPQIGRFPVPQAVNQARIPGMNIAQAGAQAGAAARPPTPAANGNVGQSAGRAPTGGSGKGGGTTLGSTAASIAGPALDAIAPGAGIAAQKGGQLLDRAIGYGAQLAGIGVSGLLETFALNDSPLADPGKSVFGRLAGGIAGAHKSADNVAGQTQPPLKPPDQPDGSPASGNGSGPKPGPGGGAVGQAAGAPLIGQMTVNHTGDPDGQRIATDIDRHLSAANPGSTR